jgi:hypothetical protein
MASIAEDISATSTANAASNISDSEFNRATIDSLGLSVRACDTDEDLTLFCYNTCGPYDSEDLKKCRGLVFDNGGKLIMKGFPYTSEFNHEQSEELDTAIPDITKCVCYTSHEGVLIRVFYHGVKWYVSTHRRLDAFRSKWASKESFGLAFKLSLDSELEKNSKFRETLSDDSETGVMEKFFETLDKSRQYMFIVRNSHENRIVCNAPETPTLYHVGTFMNGEFKQSGELNISTPEAHTFSSIVDLQDHVYSCNAEQTQGVIVMQDGNVVCKVVSLDYQKLFELRGNEPSRKFRYLQVRMDRKQNNALRNLYPDSIHVFEDYEDTIYEIAQQIHSAYVKRFIRKQFVTVPHEEFAVIKDCHTWYESDRKNNKVILSKVVEILNSHGATKINHMIRRVTADKLKKKGEADALREPSPLLPKS